MKLLKNIFLIVLSCVLLAGCSGPANPEDEQAIKDVIMTFDKAYYAWDIETQKNCVGPDFPVEDTEEMLRGAFGVYVDQGDIVAEDLEKFLEIERKSYQQGANQLSYHNWKITTSKDGASAVVTYKYPDLDANVPTYGDELTAYRNELFMSACGMDTQTAKASLSPEEYSAVYLKVTELDYAKRNENAPYVENTVEFRLTKADGKWLIAELVLPEE